MSGPRWAPEAGSRVTAAFRGAPFTERKDGTFRVDTDPRFVTARENPIALGESLYQLRELVALGEPKGKPVTPGIAFPRSTSDTCGALLSCLFVTTLRSRRCST